MQHNVLHQRHGTGPLIVPQRVLEYSHRLQHFGISVAKRAAVPALHVPILRCRIKALGVVPSQPTSTFGTAQSRAVAWHSPAKAGPPALAIKYTLVSLRFQVGSADELPVHAMHLSMI